MQIIKVFVEGGVVQDVENSLLGVVVEVYDFDIDGADEEKLETYKDRKCFISRYGAGRTMEKK